MECYQAEVVEILRRSQMDLSAAEITRQLAELARDVFDLPRRATYNRQLIDRMAALDRTLGLSRGQICQLCRRLHEQGEGTREAWLGWLQSEAIATVLPQASGL